MDNSKFDPGYTEQEDKIFQAALEVFARGGKDGATIQDIADAAGINKALVHYYFRSKEKLYEAVFNYVLKRYFQFIALSLEQTPDFRTMLETFITKYIDLIAENPRFVQFMIGELMRNPEAVHEQIRAKVEMLPTNPFQVFSARIEQAVREGEIRPVHPVHTFISILGASVMVFVMHPIGRAVIPEMREDLAGVIEQRKHHVFDLIYNGLRP